MEKLSPPPSSPQSSPQDEYVPESSSNPTSEPIVASEVTSASVPTPTPEPPKRKSRVLSRKTDHSVIERRRREKINERLIRLQETVPACREEATEMLSAKLIKKRKRTEEEIKVEIGEKMVLEKLCIISHTVGEWNLSLHGSVKKRNILTDMLLFSTLSICDSDYVEELRAQVEAYKKLCACDPPLPTSEPIGDKHQHHRFAHEHDESAAQQPSSTSNGLAQSFSSASLSSALQIISPIETTSKAPKRKRHWGSNRPPKDNQRTGNKNSNGESDGSKRGRRKSASKSKSYNEDDEEDELELDVEMESEDEDGRLGRDEDDYQPPNKNKKQKTNSNKVRATQGDESEEELDEDYMDGLEPSTSTSTSRPNQRRFSGPEMISAAIANVSNWSSGSTASSCNLNKVRAGWPTLEDSNERGRPDQPSSNLHNHIHDTSCLNENVGVNSKEGNSKHQGPKIHPSVSLSHLYASRPIEPKTSTTFSRLPSIKERSQGSSFDPFTTQRILTRSERGRTQSLSFQPSSSIAMSSQGAVQSAFCPQHSMRKSLSGVDQRLDAGEEQVDKLSLLATVCRCSEGEN